MSCLDVLEINPLSVASFAHLFPHSEDFLFSLLSQWEAAGQHRKLSWVLCDDWSSGVEVGSGGKHRREGIYAYTQLVDFIVQQKPRQQHKANIPHF